MKRLNRRQVRKMILSEVNKVSRKRRLLETMQPSEAQKEFQRLIMKFPQLAASLISCAFADNEFKCMEEKILESGIDEDMIERLIELLKIQFEEPSY